MGLAEQGGNQPQRVLLVGGPKHGEFMNLPDGQTEYDFTSSKMLLPPDAHSKDAAWNSFPETASHIYRRDERLSRALVSADGRVRFPYVESVFTHQVLWDTPYQGGFHLHALNKAYEALQRAKHEREQGEEFEDTLKEANNDLKDEVAAFQEKYEKLLSYTHSLEQRLRTVRQNLEGAYQGVSTAIRDTGLSYRSPTNAIFPEE